MKSKKAPTATDFVSRAKYKHTKQGDGTRSKPSHGRKLSRGQGK